MPRYVELVIRADNKQAIRALRELGLASDKSAARTEASFARTTSRIRKTGEAMSTVGRTMTGIGVGMAAVGYVSAKAAITFQTQMERIHTQAQRSQKQVDELSAAVLRLGKSGQVQYGPTQLAQALYHIESVGVGAYKSLQKTSTAMSVLKVAAQGAAVGGSDLEQTTTALMGAMFATHTPISQAGKMMALLNATVGAGNMRMQDLVQALGRGAIPAFKNVGLGVKDLFAALALTADQGTVASSSAAQLSTSLHYLVGPTNKAKETLAALHVPQIQLLKTISHPGGLIPSLEILRQALHKLPSWERGMAIFDILPGGRGRVLQQVLNNLDQAKGKYDAINKPAAKYNDLVKAQQQTMSGKLHAAWAQIQVDLVKFGDQLLPIISKDLPIFTNALQSIFGWFNRLSPSVKSFLAKLTVGLLIGGPIMMGLGRMLKIVAALRDLWIAVRLAAIGAGAAEAGAGAAGAGGAAAGGAAGGGIRAMLGKFIFGAGAGSGAGFLGRMGLLKGAGLAGLLGLGLYEGTKALGWKDSISKWTINASHNILNAIGLGSERSAHKITGASGVPMYNPRVAPFTHARGGVVRGYQFGGPVGTDTVPAWLTPGEGVLNRAAMSGIGTSGLAAMNSGGQFGGQFVIQPAPVYVMLDGRVLARAVLQQTLRKAARGPSSLVGGALVSGVSVPVNRGFG